MFQRVSAAYETCSKYKEGPAGFEGDFGGGRRPTYERGSDDEADEDYDDDEQGPYGHSSAFFEYMCVASAGLGACARGEWALMSAGRLRQVPKHVQWRRRTRRWWWWTEPVWLTERL